MSSQDRTVELAAVSLGFLAAEFVTLPETWSVFKKYCMEQPGSEIFDGGTRQLMLPLVRVLSEIVDDYEFHGQRNSGGDL